MSQNRGKAPGVAYGPLNRQQRQLAGLIITPLQSIRRQSPRREELRPSQPHQLRRPEPARVAPSPRDGVDCPERSRPGARVAAFQTRAVGVVLW